MVIIEDLKNHKEQICVVGLGYVGLPLAVVLAKHFSVIGFDIKEKRIAELNSSFDRTKEVESQALKESGIVFTHKPEEIKKAKFIIVAVPTPVKLGNVPDMDLVIKASEMVGKNLSKGAVVVFESTVFPGATEEICLRVLEKKFRTEGGFGF